MGWILVLAEYFDFTMIFIFGATFCSQDGKSLPTKLSCLLHTQALEEVENFEKDHFLYDSDKGKQRKNYPELLSLSFQSYSDINTTCGRSL